MFIADAHVHFHPCFRRDRFFDAAWENFARAVPDTAAADGHLPYLLLTEAPGADFFRRWSEEPPRAARWRVKRTEESCSLALVRSDGATMVVVAGRQVPTAERLEVLALGTTEKIETGLRFQDCLLEAKRSARVVCVPWGFGKWTSTRGRLVRDALRTAGPCDFTLGDNAGRPLGTPVPPPFRTARHRGVLVLPGSDPLPFARHESRAGSFCFTVEGRPDRRRPMEGLTAALAAGGTVTPRGRRVGWLGFVRDQTELRVTRAAARRGVR